VRLLHGKSKTSIADTVDRKHLPAENYIMRVVSEGKTASILFTIKYRLSARNDSFFLNRQIDHTRRFSLHGKD